jgi:hypothetical protein
VLTVLTPGLGPWLALVGALAPVSVPLVLVYLASREVAHPVHECPPSLVPRAAAAIFHLHISSAKPPHLLEEALSLPPLPTPILHRYPTPRASNLQTVNQNKRSEQLSGHCVKQRSDTGNVPLSRAAFALQECSLKRQLRPLPWLARS